MNDNAAVVLRQDHPCCKKNALQVFIFMTGVFVSSWVGGALLSVGEWIIKKLPLIKHIYSAAKQVTGGLNPENGETKSFRECVIIRHPRHGEYAVAFITGETVFQVRNGCSRTGMAGLGSDGSGSDVSAPGHFVILLNQP